MAHVFVWTRVGGTPALWVAQSAAAPVPNLQFAPGGYGAVGGTYSASRRSLSFLAAPANPPGSIEGSLQIAGSGTQRLDQRSGRLHQFPAGHHFITFPAPVDLPAGKG